MCFNYHALSADVHFSQRCAIAIYFVLFTTGHVDVDAVARCHIHNVVGPRLI